MLIPNFFLFPFLLFITISTPIEILKSLTFPYQQKLNLAKSLRDYFQRQIILNSAPYQCITPIKDMNSLAKTEKQLYSKPQMKDDLAFVELLLLEDESVIHYTSTFLYEYKHKKFIRQYDDEDTKARNAKKEYEDIQMGRYKQETKNKIERQFNEEELKTLNYRYEFAESTQKLQIQVDHKNNVIRFNKPLQSKSFKRNMLYQINCRIDTATPHVKQEIIYSGMAISNFQVALQNWDQFQCTSVSKLTEVPDYREKADDFRYIRNIIYGKINKFCQIDESSPLKVGEVLIIREGQQVQKKEEMEQYLVRIQEIIGEEAFKTSMYFTDEKIKSCERISEKDVGMVGKVSFLLSSSNIIKGKYLRGGLMKFQKQLEAGSRLNCFNEMYVFSTKYYQIKQVLLGTPFGTQYVEVFNLKDPEQYGNIFSQKSTFYCIPENEQAFNMKSKNRTSFNNFTSLSLIYQNKQFLPNGDSDDEIYGITISDEGVVEMQTETTKNDHKTINKYILTKNKIYKIETLNNGTKLQMGENLYYENNTSTNIIWIHKGIWRLGDFLKFPRILMQNNEKVISIKANFGFAYVRSLHLQILGKDNFLVSSQFLHTHSGYGPKKRPEKSTSTEFRFKDGEFCGGSINRFRQTLVKVRCGSSWLQIDQVKETSPCVYELKITSQFLCSEGEEVPALGNGIMPFNGTVCYLID